jgi:hypothetical protein
LTVIAVCLVWLSVGGPSLITTVHAQLGDSVLLAGWVDAKDNVVKFPEVPRFSDPQANTFGDRTRPYAAWALPTDTNR